MNTRTVKVTRSIKLTKSVIMEIPQEISNHQLESALLDRCESYEMLLTAADKYDMDESDEEIEVKDSSEPSEHFEVSNEEWMDSLKSDDLID